MNVIETKNLTKYYGKARGIIDVGFEAKEILLEGLNRGYMLLAILIIISILFITYNKYKKRDLYV